VPKIEAVRPYTPLELTGRDLYIREGCVGCHSQMVRPFRSETERYGEYSKSGEFIYDRPFLWGSKRTGPDLHRLGGKYPDSWHFNHMLDPESMSPGSIMPPYPWLIDRDVDLSALPDKIRVLRTLGTPYEPGYETIAVEDAQKQARIVAENLRRDGIDMEGLENKEIVALIAYLQRLGTDIKPKPQAGN
jgi:cytochrome c oxidase cbb3-type subunit I/II